MVCAKLCRLNCLLFSLLPTTVMLGSIPDQFKHSHRNFTPMARHAPLVLAARADWQFAATSLSFHMHGEIGCFSSLLPPYVVSFSSLLPFSYPCVLNPNNRTLALLFHVSSFIVCALAGHTSYPCILNSNNRTLALLFHVSSFIVHALAGHTSYPCVLHPNNRTLALLFHISSFIVRALAGHTSYPCILNLNNHTLALLLHAS